MFQAPIEGFVIDVEQLLKDRDKKFGDWSLCRLGSEQHLYSRLLT